MLGILIVLTVLDTVLVAVVFYYYTDTYANFINQAGGFIYAFVSTGHRYMLVRSTRASSDGGQLDVDLLKEEGNERAKHSNPVPWYILVAIGFLNGTGNFFLSVGQVHVRGETQSIMALIGVPLVMFLSWVCLRKTPSLIAIGAAALIVAATLISSLPSMLHPEDDGVVEYWYSALLFLVGCVFQAAEKVTTPPPPPPLPSLHSPSLSLSKVLEESVFERYVYTYCTYCTYCIYTVCECMACECMAYECMVLSAWC
jgi:drug/metabolite transporter (DMT)-like permease